MQLRWLAIGVVCFSAALQSACGSATGDTLSARSPSSAISKSTSRYDSSGKNANESDECDASGVSSDANGTCKVTICHIPPGNPDNRHTIRVGEPAVQAHIDHGDYPGACDPVDPPPPPPPQCLPDMSVCTVDADCCPGSICLPDPIQGTACGIPG